MSNLGSAIRLTDSGGSATRRIRHLDTASWSSPKRCVDASLEKKLSWTRVAGEALPKGTIRGSQIRANKEPESRLEELNDRSMYTHTHIHTYIYIYIYIHIDARQ